MISMSISNVYIMGHNKIVGLILLAFCVKHFLALTEVPFILIRALIGDNIACMCNLSTDFKPYFVKFKVLKHIKQIISLIILKVYY